MGRDLAGDLWLYRGDGKGGLQARTKVGTGWSGFDSIFGAGDFDGDGHVDLLARDAASHGLWLYRGARGSFGAASKIGTGWEMMTQLLAADVAPAAAAAGPPVQFAYYAIGSNPSLPSAVAGRTQVVILQSWRTAERDALRRANPRLRALVY